MEDLKSGKPKFLKPRSSGQWLQEVMGNPTRGFTCKLCRRWFDWTPPPSVHKAIRENRLHKIPGRKLIELAEKARRPDLCRSCSQEILNTPNHPFRLIPPYI